MAAVQYTAKRSIGGGHAIDTQYALDLVLAATNGGPKRRRRVETQTSLDGNVETLYFGRDFIFEVQLAPFRWLEQPYLREFLDSTEDGHAFTFDLYGSVATPYQPLTVVRDDDGYDESRVLSVGTGGAEDYVTVNFRVRTT